MKFMLSKQIHKILILLAGSIIMGFLAWDSAHASASKEVLQKINQFDQNPLNYLNEENLKFSIPDQQQSELVKSFLKLYFSPWDRDSAFTHRFIAKIYQDTQKNIQKFSNMTLWQLNNQAFNEEDLKKIFNNANFSGFPNVNRPGIIIQTSQARDFPTLLPAYSTPTKIGQGYPFDRWIMSYAFPTTPVKVLQISSDHDWYFVQTSSYYGWVPVFSVAFVDQKFIDEWKSYPFVVALEDNVTLYSETHSPISKIRKGLIYPSLGTQGKLVKLAVPLFGKNGQVQIEPAFAHVNEIQNFPLAANPQNIAQYAKTFMKALYGWGDLYELRDCSSTTMSIMAPFGIWLPRNSFQQARMGKTISFEGMTKKHKLDVLSQEAVPFYTLINFKGHVGLYLGSKNDKLFMLHNTWGFHFLNSSQEDGFAVGSTVITPLNYQKNMEDISKANLESISSISILLPESYSDLEKIKLKIWSIPESDFPLDTD